MYIIHSDGLEFPNIYHYSALLTIICGFVYAFYAIMNCCGVFFHAQKIESFFVGQKWIPFRNRYKKTDYFSMPNTCMYKNLEYPSKPTVDGNVQMNRNIYYPIDFSVELNLKLFGKCRKYSMNTHLI